MQDRIIGQYPSIADWRCIVLTPMLRDMAMLGYPLEITDDRVAKVVRDCLTLTNPEGPVVAEDPCGPTLAESILRHLTAR